MWCNMQALAFNTQLAIASVYEKAVSTNHKLISSTNPALNKDCKAFCDAGLEWTIAAATACAFVDAFVQTQDSTYGSGYACAGSLAVTSTNYYVNCPGKCNV
jgi:hypothetical protein